MKTILVTGGAGFIGSHTVVDLVQHDYKVVIVDNLSNSSAKSIKAIEDIVKSEIDFFEADIRDKDKLSYIFSQYKFDGVINFAGYKAVGESVELPLKYYDNNIGGMVSLLEVMEEFGVNTFVFSSSATVYGIPEKMPLTEGDKTGAASPYGRTKLFIENILSDVALSSQNWKIISLRYFNPLGAHESGSLGEDPNGIPNNLAPYITQVAIGKLDKLNVFGNDYNTPDGTCIRDYVHINDLALGHRLAMEYMFKQNESVNEIINLGSGKGYSVFEIINSFEKIMDNRIPYDITKRRRGDIDISIASIDKAKELLKWEPRYDILKMCEDMWRWQQQNPNGFH
jgi:UDP-glucose 4-epimerase